MKIRLILGLALTCSCVFAQTPRPVAAYINGGSGWNPWASAGGFGSLSFTPQPIALYCQASAGAAWQPCNPSGGGGGAVSSVFGRTGAVAAVANDYSFDQINSGTSLGHGLVVGAGSVFTTAGNGVINANEIGGTLLSGLATGPLCNTTTTGVPSICTGLALLGTAQTWTALQTFGANAAIGATAHGVLISEAGAAVVATAVGATNTVLHGNTGADPSYSAIVAADITNATITGAKLVNATIGATQLAAQYSKGSCTEVWGGSGTSFALTSGDDAISNNTCYNDSGVTRTITAVKCRSTIASNTTTVNPTFGAAGTGTTILSGALTCGSSLAYSSTGTVTNAAWVTGAGITPAMGGTLTGTSIAMIVEYTF